MNQVLKLESFRRLALPEVPAEPTFSATELAEAGAEGFARGRAEATSAAHEAMVAAVAQLAQALRDDAARGATLAAAWQAQTAPILGAVVASLGGPLRPQALAGRVVEAVLAEVADDQPTPAMIRCEAGAAALLRQALKAGGIAGVTVEETPTGSGAEYGVGGGLVRVGTDRIEAALAEIIAEIGTAQEGE